MQLIVRGVGIDQHIRPDVVSNKCPRALYLYDQAFISQEVQGPTNCAVAEAVFVVEFYDIGQPGSRLIDPQAFWIRVDDN